MKFVHKATGLEVKLGDEVKGSDGSTMIVSGWQKPTSPASQGRINVVRDMLELPNALTLAQSYYASVYGCEWIEREDRDEAAPLLREADAKPIDAKYLGQLDRIGRAGCRIIAVTNKEDGIPVPLVGHWTDPDIDMINNYAARDRNRLMMGDMTDFELANAQFMVDRGSLELIAFQTAAKERIRWLSVQLAIAKGDIR